MAEWLMHRGTWFELPRRQYLEQDTLTLQSMGYIRKICPCIVYPLIPHFYVAELGYAGVYLFFLFLLQNIDCGLEQPRRGGSNVYPQSMY